VRDREQPLDDPYRTLGLEPDASMAEVKRAYRRLAKAFHPDSAGEAALPRFLAIHEAYERLNSGRTRATIARPTHGTTSEPWRADPDRARAARERARTRRTGTSGGGASARGGGAPAGGPRADSAGRTGTTGAASGSAQAGPTGSTGSSRRSGGRRRDARKATLGSTSYDEARDPADATWSGASWYGPTTGEYWIVNPREYADPRKHGPGYQQRGQRPSGAAESTIEQGEEPVAARSAPGRAEGTWDPDAPRAEASDARSPAASRDAGRWSATARPGWAAVSAAGGVTAAGDDARGGRASADSYGGPGDAGVDPLGPFAPFGPVGRDWLGTSADDPIRRLGLALVAWPPIGLAAGAAIGEITGCTAYSAECGGSDLLLPWLAQAAILGLLLLLPPLARLFVGGTIAVLLALVPITAFLLVLGAGGAPQAALVMAGLLALAWLGGVGWAAFAGRRRRASGLAS
jgi:curved DNA-binding protein CbpA